MSKGRKRTEGMGRVWLGYSVPLRRHGFFFFFFLSHQILKGLKRQAETFEFHHSGQRELLEICGQGEGRMTSISSDYATSTSVQTSKW